MTKISNLQASKWQKSSAKAAANYFSKQCQKHSIFCLKSVQKNLISNFKSKKESEETQNVLKNRRIRERGICQKKKSLSVSHEYAKNCSDLVSMIFLSISHAI